MQDWDDNIYLVYAILMNLLQFLVPLVIISSLYVSIWRYLKSIRSPGSSLIQQRKMERLQRTNLILVSISFLFFISLLPIHIYSLLLNFLDMEVKGFDISCFPPQVGLR